MKTLIKAVVLGLIVVSPSYGGDLGGSFKVGTGVSTRYDGTVRINDSRGVFTKVTINYDFVGIFLKHSVHGGWETHSDVKTFFGYRPYKDIYWVGYKILLNRWSFDISHYCSHPVYANPERWDAQDHQVTKGTILSFGIDW